MHKELINQAWGLHNEEYKQMAVEDWHCALLALLITEKIVKNRYQEQIGYEITQSIHTKWNRQMI